MLIRIFGFGLGVLLCSLGRVLGDDSGSAPLPPESDIPFASFFEAGRTELDVSIGAGYGVPMLGSEIHHHLALGNIEFGWMLSDVVGRGHWYQGSWEVLLDLFGGAQWHPDTAYLVGGGPEFRYNFVTGTRWVPFLTCGAGVTSTDIRDGDLSTNFEFNLHGGAGLHYFLKENFAITAQVWVLHLSNAGMDYPNLGVNSITGLIGVGWFF